MKTPNNTINDVTQILNEIRSPINEDAREGNLEKKIWKATGCRLAHDGNSVDRDYNNSKEVSRKKAFVKYNTGKSVRKFDLVEVIEKGSSYNTFYLVDADGRYEEVFLGVGTQPEKRKSHIEDAVRMYMKSG